MCDCGGWTDTWFARTGRVCHLAIEPGAVVDLVIRPREPGEPAATIDAGNYGPPYAFSPSGRRWGAHPLLEAAIESVGLPADWHATIRVTSDMPPGAAVGTSAAVTVALLGALRMAAGETLEPGIVAAAAHAVETEWLGHQSGVQDQVAAAFGGVNLVDIPAYPSAVVRPLLPSPEFLERLQRRFLLVVMGHGHRSTEIHDQVIRDVTGIGPDHPALVALRRTATMAAEAIEAGRPDQLGRAMTDATEAQRLLHPALVSADAQGVIATARSRGALGWKVNGAGGEGGSLTILGGPDPVEYRALVQAIQEDPRCRVIPIALAASGLSVSAQTQGLRP